MIKQDGILGVEDYRVPQTSIETYHLNKTHRLIACLSVHLYRRAELVLAEGLLLGTSIYQI